MSNGASFDRLRSVKDPEKRLRLTTEFEDKIRLAKDAAADLWVVNKKTKKKPKQKKPEEEEKKKPDDEELDRFLQMLIYILCAIYAMGWNDVEDEIEEDIGDVIGDLESVEEIIDGETIADRLDDAETYEDVERIIDTEAHRNYNAGAYRAAKESGLDLQKTWRTMLDDRVRDSHSYLEGVTVGLDDYFYTFGGAKALYPGQFGEPDEDINCRCFIEYTET